MGLFGKRKKKKALQREEQEKDSLNCNRGEILEFLTERYEGVISKEVIAELAEIFARDFTKKIKIEIFESWDFGLRFTCNLSPLEMEERNQEVRALLPRTQASDDTMYNIVIRKAFWEDKKTLPKRCEDKPNWWLYYAFVV